MEKLIYSDGNDYSHLDANSDGFDVDAVEGEYNGTCTNCGSENITTLSDRDVCHDCGNVYT